MQTRSGKRLKRSGAPDTQPGKKKAKTTKTSTKHPVEQVDPAEEQDSKMERMAMVKRITPCPYGLHCFRQHAKFHHGPRQETDVWPQAARPSVVSTSERLSIVEAKLAQLEKLTHDLRTKVVKPADRPSDNFPNAFSAAICEPKTRMELLAIQLAGAIRNKPRWSSKFLDATIRHKWRKEITEGERLVRLGNEAKKKEKKTSTAAKKETKSKQKGKDSDGDSEESEESDDESRKSAQRLVLSDALIEYVFAELAYQATHATRQSDGCSIDPAAIPGVFQSDGLVPSELKSALAEAAQSLENVSPDRIDWHPGSDNQVMDLVHPSLFCLVHGVSPILTKPAENMATSMLSMGLDAPTTTDADGQTDEKQATDGKKSRPDKQQRAKFAFALPESESDYRFDVDELPKATRSKRFQWLPSEFVVGDDGRTRIASYINNLHPEWHAPLYGCLERLFDRFVPLFEHVLHDLRLKRTDVFRVDPYRWYDHLPSPKHDGDDQAYETFMENRMPGHPDVPKYKAPDSWAESDALNMLSLRGQRLQVIVKMANIVLTPKNSTYKGGVWHVEGMENECIVATGIYYARSDNITESRLSFRRAVATPEYEQNDNSGVREIYGLENGGPLQQYYGAVTTLEDRCIAFPNIYQHRVEPFELRDKTKPGHRKIVVFFLVDPNQRVVSTANVPPQQRHWLEDELSRWTPLERIPAPVRRLIFGYLDPEHPMTLEVAQAFRAQLMNERKYLRDELTRAVFEREFSLCEH